MRVREALSTLREHLRERRDIDALDNRDESVMEAMASLVARTIEPYHRAEIRGIERVPEGGALYVSSHTIRAYMPETYLLSLAIYRRFGMAAVPYGLMHEGMLELPVINPLMTSLGAVRASHHNGERLLQAGKKVLVFPERDVDARRPFENRDRGVFDDQNGLLRLALRTNVPIVPVVAVGVSLPLPSKILMEILEPVRFARTGPEAAEDDRYVTSCGRAVQENMQAALTRLAAERRG